MKIVCLNLWNGGRLFDQMRDFLISQKADIYLLQEAYNGHDVDFEPRFKTVDLLKSVFSDYHIYFVPFYVDTRSKEGKIEDGQLMISRYPLTNRKMIWFDTPYGEYDNDALSISRDLLDFPAGVQTAQIEYQGKSITLLNVHGPWNDDGQDDSVRRQTMRDKLLAEVGEHTIMAGDFNGQPKVPSIRDLETKLVNVFGHDLTTTFNVKRKDLVKFPGYATAPVDMMFITPDIGLVSKQVLEVDISDHLPLIVELEVK